MILWNVLFTDGISYIGSRTVSLQLDLASDREAKESVNSGFDIISFNLFHKSVFSKCI